MDFVHEGNDYFVSDKFNEAVEAYRKAANADESLEDAHLGLCYALLKMERYEEALDASRIALEKFPENKLVHYRAGEALFAMKRYQEALQEFESSQDIQQANSYIRKCQLELR